MLAPNPALSADAEERPGAGAPVIEILSADKVFPNGTRALAAIDLTIAGGEFLTLIGPSGCGKSTLLKILAGVERPDRGSAEIDGLDLWKDEVDARRHLVYVSEQADLDEWNAEGEID